MAIAFNAVTSDFDNSTSPSVSHTAAGSDRYLFIYVHALADTTISAISYGAQTPTLIERFNLGFGGSNTMFVYGLVAPNTGAQTAAATLADAAGWSIIVVSYTGVDQVTPIGTESIDQAADSSPLNVDVASDVGDTVIDFFFSGGDAITAAGGQTERIDTDHGGALGTRRWGVSDKAGAATTTTMEWAITNPFEESGIIGVAMNAAAGGGATLMGAACL
jgi:hypothetical protein